MNPLLYATALVPYFSRNDWYVTDDLEQNGPPKATLTPEAEERLRQDLIALFNSVSDPELLAPLRYIRGAIRRMIDDSSASAETKRNVDSQTKIQVRIRKDVSSVNLGLVGTALKPGPLETRHLPLEDIVTDIYRRKIAGYSEIRTLWPSDFPNDLIETLKSANLQKSYQDTVSQRLNNPDSVFMLRLKARMDVEDRLRHFAARTDVAPTFAQLAQSYFDGNASLAVIEYRSPSSRIIIGQALCLRQPYSTSDALLIFLDEPLESAVFVLPHKLQRPIMQGSVRLRQLVLKNLPLNHQRRSHNDKLTYHYTYTTVGYPKRIAPLHFISVDNVFATLHKTLVDRLLSDIDVLVLTDSERDLDKLLEIGAFVLGGLCLTASLPLGPGAVATRMFTAFLLGQGATALKLQRAANSDDPKEMEAQLFKEVVIAFSRLVTPIFQNLLNDALTPVEGVDVELILLEQLSKALNLVLK